MGKMKAPWHEDFGDSAQPAEGFQYPEAGDIVTCLQDYELPDSGHTVLPAGTAGTVTGLRLPGSYKEDPGYIGCIMFFKEAAEYDPRSGKSAPYPAGLVVPWDFVSNPNNFRFGKPETEAKQEQTLAL